MRLLSIAAVLAATPVMAHENALPHAHSEWALPVGLGMILLAAATSMKARVKVRK